MNKIYLIWDLSYDRADTARHESVIFASTNRELAVYYFDMNYGKTSQLDSDQTVYEYKLVEYPEGYTGKEEIKILRSVSNVN